MGNRVMIINGREYKLVSRQDGKGVTLEEIEEVKDNKDLVIEYLNRRITILENKIAKIVKTLSE